MTATGDGKKLPGERNTVALIRLEAKEESESACVDPGFRGLIRVEFGLRGDFPQVKKRLGSKDKNMRPSRRER